MIDIYKILEKYQIDNDIFCDEEELTRRIKEIIWSDLDEIDRRVLLIYSELGSLRRLGKELNVSSSAAQQKIKQIKNKILSQLKNDKPADNN